MQTRKWFKTAVVVIAAVAIIAVVGGAAYLKLSAAPYVAGSAAPELQPSDLPRLDERRIFFGHQSVGENILEGVTALDEAEGAGLPVVPVDSAEQLRTLSGGFIADYRIGKNGDPQSKFNSFNDMMRSGAGERVDIAMMKLCYSDFSATVTPRFIFEDYRDMMAALESDYPNVAFVYATVPLTESGGYKNMLRTQFNSLVRSELADKNIFDIADVEAASPQAVDMQQSFYGFSYESLRPEYSSDGVHLNAVGSERAARVFLVEASTALDQRADSGASSSTAP